MRQPQQNCCSCHTNSQCMACRTYCCGHRIAGCLTTKFTTKSHHKVSPRSLTTKSHHEVSPRSLTTKSHHKVSPQSFTHEALPQSPLGGPAGKSNTGTQLKRFFSRGSSQEAPSQGVPTRKFQPGSSSQEVLTKKFQPRSSKPEGSKSGESKPRSSQSRISS